MDAMKEIIDQENKSSRGSTSTSFAVTVCFTKNSTWQGRIHWVEKNKRQNFRSALEMLKLMDEAVSERTDNGDSISWDS